MPRERITNADLDQLVAVLCNITERKYYIESAYGKPRLYLSDDYGDHEISPRLGKRELYQWIDAYIEGINAGRNLERYQ